MIAKRFEGVILRLLAYAFFILLVFSQTQLRLGPLVFYPPEVLLYPTFVILWLIPASRTRLVTSYRALPQKIKVALGLLLFGAFIGTIVSPLFPTSIGAFKAWIVSPLLLSWLLISFYRQRTAIIFEGVALFGLLVSFTTFYLAYQGEDLGRATAYFNSPNTLAAVVGPIGVLTFWRGYQRGQKLWYLVATIILVTLVLSRSLGGLLGVAGAVVFGFRHLTSRWKYGVVTLIIIGAIGSFFILRDRTTSTENSLSGREQIWVVGIHLVKVWPITGAGLRGFEYHYPHLIGGLVKEPQEWAAVPQPHNIALAVWTGIGLFGLIGFFGLIYYLLIWRGVPTPAHLAVVAVLFHGLIDTPYWRVDLTALLWVYLGLLWVTRLERDAAEIGTEAGNGTLN